MARISIHKERVVDLTASLVRINSVNPSLAPGGPGEAAIAAFVAEVLRGMGLEAQIEEAAPGRPDPAACVHPSRNAAGPSINSGLGGVEDGFTSDAPA